MSYEVAVVNETTVVDDVLAWRYAWTLWYQVAYHFGPAWKIGARVIFLQRGAAVPVGASILHLLDTSDVQGALGYHDEEGNEVPYARVFCKTAKEDGIDPCEVASHELLELLVDPHVNLSALDPARKRLYALEVGDPAQGNGYQIGKAGETLTVADFAKPNYFDPNTSPNADTSYRRSCKGPFSLAPEGYMSFLDLTKYSAGWQSEFGSKRQSAPNDDRLDRRNAAFAAAAQLPTP